MIAARYDRVHADRFERSSLDPTIGLLAELAQDGPALEFAIGTGRVALPLRERGIDVHGMDISEPMVAELRAKPGGGDVPVTIGDMTETVVGSDFALAYLVFNTIGNVTSQDGQAACFANAARQLRPGGRFVIEVGVPGIAGLAPGETRRVFAHSDDYLGFDDYTDAVNQVFTSNHWRLNEPDKPRVAGTFRWVWPSELDLMARLAGLEFESRWADWHRAPFTGESPAHVSVWRKPG